MKNGEERPSCPFAFNNAHLSSLYEYLPPSFLSNCNVLHLVLSISLLENLIYILGL